jgi:hypothetical protein
LSSLTYKKADGSLIGDLQYAYDKAGRRTKQSGSLVTATQPGLGQLPSLPAGASSLTASYDANHRLTNWGGQAYSYDANGNLVNDGQRTYTWNARNELTSLSGAATARFSDDPAGRRTGKSIGSTPQTTGYLYDGDNFVQELGEANTTQSGTDAPQATLIANLLTAGIDQTQLRQRLTATGTSITASTAEHFLTDANNNTLALADATQTLSTRYSDDVYGQTTQTTLSGTPSDPSAVSQHWSTIHRPRERWHRLDVLPGAVLPCWLCAVHQRGSDRLGLWPNQQLCVCGWGSGYLHGSARHVVNWI